MYSRINYCLSIVSLLLTSALNGPAVYASAVPQIDSSGGQLDSPQEWATPANLQELLQLADKGDEEAQMFLLNYAYRGIINFRGQDEELPSWLLGLVKKNIFRAKVVKFDTDHHKRRNIDIDGSEILSELTTQAERGDTNALFWRGIIELFSWPGHPRNIDEVDRYLQSAADRGHAAAHYTLSFSLWKDKVTRQEKIHHLTRAAELGLTTAQEQLGLEHLYHGDRKNKIQQEEAFKWLSRAGTANANESLGGMFQSNWDDPSANLDQAIYYYYLAAKQGNKLVRKYNIKNYLLPVSKYSVTNDDWHVEEIDAVKERLQTILKPLQEDLLLIMYRYMDLPREDQYLSIMDFSHQIREIGAMISDHLATSGFMVSCIEPEDMLLSYYRAHPDVEKVGFCLLEINATRYSCLGGDNPKLGFALEQLLGIKRNQVLATINEVKEELETTKKQMQGNPDELNNLEQEIQLLNQAPVLIDQSLDMVKGWVAINVGGRNKAFVDENPWLF